MISKIKSLAEDYKVLLRNVPALVTCTFVLTTVLMNIAAAKVIFNAGNVALTGGFILSFAPFLAMDVATKRFGARASIMLNVLSAFFNVISVIFLWIVAAIPTEAPYLEFNYIFSSVWFIVVSSTVAFVASGVVNSVLNAAIGKLFKKTSVAEFVSRSFASTFVGQAIDNFLFIAGVYVVFAPKFWGLDPMPILTCVGTAIVGGLIELALEVVMSPVGYRIIKRWEKEDIGRDYLEYIASKESYPFIQITSGSFPPVGVYRSARLFCYATVRRRHDKNSYSCLQDLFLNIFRVERYICLALSPSGKAQHFDCCMREFESR